MRKAFSITLTGSVQDTTIMGGDAADFGEAGVLVWFVDEDAAAYRLYQEKRQREIRAVIDHVVVTRKGVPAT